MATGTVRPALGAAIVALTLSVFLSAQDDASLLLGPEHQDSRAGFAFRPPAHWKSGKSADGKVRFLFTGPVPPAPPPTVSVTVLKAETSFDKLTRNLEDRLSGSYAQIATHSKIRYLIDHVYEAWRMDFSFTDEKGRKRRTLLAFDIGERYVVARYTCPESSAERFQKVFDASVRSCRILASQETKAAPEFAETYADAEAGFSLDPPAGWSVDRSGRLGPKVIFVGPKRPDGTVPNIVVEVREDARALPGFVDAVRDSLRKSNTDFQLRAERTRYDATGKAADFLLEYVFVFNNVRLRSVKLFAAGHGDRKYTVTCTTPVKWFRGFRRVFSLVCDTFRTFPPADIYLPFRLKDNRYVDYKGKFSLAPPKGWTVLPGNAPGMRVRFIGPPSQGYRPEINIVCDENNAPLSGYAEAVQQVMARSLSGLVIHSSASGDIGGLPSHAIEFGARSGESQLRNMKMIVAAPGRKLILSLGARESDFSRQKKLFLECAQSLEVQ